MVFSGCGDDPATDDGDAAGGDMTDVADVGPDGEDAGDASDASDAADSADTSDTDAGAGLGFLCEPCVEDSECGSSEDRCLQMPDGVAGCTRSCQPDTEGTCPDDFFCALLDEETQDYQCVPEQLTCEDRCVDVACGDGQVCDPWTGECGEPLGICDQECTTSAVCGDGPEDQCITMPGTDGERVCLTGCNPQSENRECPLNYFCNRLTDDEDTEEGICVPLEGTCVDRCAGVECGAGENCDVLTGQCEQVEFGYCESGCTSDAECGGPNDRCLNLGFDDGAQCWQDCADNEDICTENYECRRLTGTTVSICLPLGQTCGDCDETSCYPDGVCDPISGECVELDTDCTETGCAEGLLCDPVSTDCVEPGRACAGDSWAADCDNVVTACTTRRADTEGTCEEICTSDAQCPTGESCVDTDLRRFCLPDDLGSPLTCGTFVEADTSVGTPCGSGLSSCPNDANICVQAGNLDGFCSRACTDATDCDAGQACQTGPGGQAICVPAQCGCAATPALGADLFAAWNQALPTLEIDQCDLWIDPSLASALTELSDTPLADATIEALVEFPMAGVVAIEEHLNSLDSASSSPTAGLEAAARTLGLSVSGSAGTYTYPGSESKLTQAVANFITDAGGTPDMTQLETQAQDVPADFQDVAAPIISAAADALAAREAALQSAGWGATERAEAFAWAPYLVLPGSAQTGAAPDLSDPAVAERYEDFPLEAVAQAAADLSATLEQATASTSGASGWTGFSYVVDTPAGKIVLGDAADTVYDPATNSDYAGELAVLIDAGGDDTYRVPLGANGSVENGVAVAVDLGGSDTYTYNEVSDPNDSAELLPSDADGRQTPAGPLNQYNGPVSLSDLARQGAGRLGIGILMDLGTELDTYRSLRMSQGAALFGVGMLYDEAGNDEFQAEAFAQGAAMKGLGMLLNPAGDDTYSVWHAGQGYGTAAGTGVLYDADGADNYEAVTGEAGGEGVLYLSTADRARSNRNLAQGAGVGLPATSQETGLGGGIGILRDLAGTDAYTAATYAQGFGTVRAVGVLADAGGDDIYNGRGIVQGAGDLAAAGVLVEEGGADEYNQSSIIAQNGQGTGRELGWGVHFDAGGDDTITYMTPGGGVGLDGGLGFAFFADGIDSHTSSTEASWGYANNGASAGTTLGDALTVGIFLDAGADTDSYTRPNIGTSDVGNDSVWLQPDVATFGVERGVGVDE